MHRQLRLFDSFLNKAKSDVPPARGKKKPRASVGPRLHAPETLAVGRRLVRIVRRPRKRTMALTLQANGEIRVTAPHSASSDQISQFVALNDAWIENHQGRYEDLRGRYPRKHYAEGELFLFLGAPTPLHYVAGDVSRPTGTHRTGEAGAALLVAIPRAQWPSFDPRAPHPEMKPVIASFYERAGRAALAERLAVWVDRMGLRPSSISFRSQKTRWGSCSAKGRVSLNWRLAIAPAAVIDYVIAHELSHLVHYNHSPAFWGLVGAHVPDYEARRRWLRDHQYEADFLAKRSELHPAQA